MGQLLTNTMTIDMYMYDTYFVEGFSKIKYFKLTWERLGILEIALVELRAFF